MIVALFALLGLVIIPGMSIVESAIGIVAIAYGVVSLVQRRTRKYAAIWPAITGITLGGIATLIGLPLAIYLVLLTTR